MPEVLRFGWALWITLGLVALGGIALALARFGLVRATPPVERFARGFGGAVVLIALLGLAWRVGFAIVARRDQTFGLSDSAYYLGQGQLLAAGYWFVEPFLASSKPSIIAPGAGHPPLYSTWFGIWAYLGVKTEMSARITSSLLGAGAVVVIGYATRRVAGARAGIIAAVVAAVYGNLWLNDVMVAAESLYALTIAWVVLASYRIWERPGPARAVELGAAISFAALTRAEAVLLFALIPVPLLLWRHRAELLARAKLVGIMALVAALLLGPWSLWNLSRFEKPTTLSVGAGYTLMLGNCDETYDPASPTAGYWTYRCDPWLNPDDPRGPGPPRDEIYDQSVLESLYREKAMEYLRANASEYPLTYLMRVARLFGLFKVEENLAGDVGIERRGYWPARVALLQWWILGVLSIVGVWALRRRRIPVSPFAALLLSVLAAMVFGFGITRYRLPVDVAVVILGSVGIDALLRPLRREPDPEVPRPASTDFAPPPEPEPVPA